MKLYLRQFAMPALLLAVFAGGCAVGPNYERPAVNLPDTWTTYTASGAGDANELTKWWKQFNDPVLDELMALAWQNSPTLEQAFIRVLESKTRRDQAAGVYWLDVDGTGSYRRSRTSENSYEGQFMSNNDAFDTYSVGIEAGWEIDLFGRISRSVESAEYRFEADIEDYRAVLVALYAEVARNYVDIRTAQARIDYARKNLEIQRETLELTQSRYDAGIAPRLDVEQAKTNLANTESEIPMLRKAEAAGIHRLAALTGRYPSTLGIDLKSWGAIPSISGALPDAIPGDVLRQRPDVRKAERLLAAQVAKIGYAKADLYPQLSLTGNFHLTGKNFGDLGKWSSRGYGFGPAFHWNLFDGDRVRNQVRIEELRTLAAYHAYEQAIFEAVEDIENAGAFTVQDQRRLEALERSTESAAKSVELVETLYRNGLTDFQNVLDSQRTLSAQQDNLAAARGQIAQDWIGIYSALGGGWGEPDELERTLSVQIRDHGPERNGQDNE